MSEKRLASSGDSFVGLTEIQIGDLLNKLSDENTRLHKKVDEQQATIRKLQDLCGQSDGENAKLRIENKRLQEENEQLKEEIKAYHINEQYAEEIIEQNQKLRIERNGLRRENEQLQKKNKQIGFLKRDLFILLNLIKDNPMEHNCDYIKIRERWE